MEPSTGADPTPDWTIREASLAPFGKPVVMVMMVMVMMAMMVFDLFVFCQRSAS